MVQLPYWHQHMLDDSIYSRQRCNLIAFYKIKIYKIKLKIIIFQLIKVNCVNFYFFIYCNQSQDYKKKNLNSKNRMTVSKKHINFALAEE